MRFDQDGFSPSSEGRMVRLLESICRSSELDLDGLTVYTEAASGPYLGNPVLAALAGAEVYALVCDSSYASASDVERDTVELARRLDLADKIHIVGEKHREDVARSDFITNSGFVRPIDNEMVSWMKPTATIPLMWETWEFRSADLDLQACKAKGILVMGTNETTGVNMVPYNGMMATKLILELGLEVVRSRVLVLGGQKILGAEVVKYLRHVGACVDWFGAEGSEAPTPYGELQAFFEEFGGSFDLLLLAEHAYPGLLLGEGGHLTFDSLVAINPEIRLGIIAGNIDAAGLEGTNLAYLPRTVRPFGYMSYQPHELGPRPILELFDGGLKVGSAMSRARLSGMSVVDAARLALEASPAMDLLGEDSWL